MQCHCINENTGKVKNSNMKESQISAISMKRIHKSILFIIILFMPSLLFAGQTPQQQADAPIYSLEDFYRLGLERSELIGIAENQLYIAEKDVDRAFSTLVPTLSGYGYYLRYDNEGLT